MRNGLWVKGFGIGIIILFLGTIVPPGITANGMEVKTINKDINNLEEQNSFRTGFTIIIIGYIKDLWMPYENMYIFTLKRGILAIFFDGKLRTFSRVTEDSGIIQYFEDMIGFIDDHRVCAVFHYEYP